jgi:hypothetical protein
MEEGWRAPMALWTVLRRALAVAAALKASGSPLSPEPAGGYYDRPLEKVLRQWPARMSSGTSGPGVYHLDPQVRQQRCDGFVSSVCPAALELKILLCGWDRLSPQERDRRWDRRR